MQRLAGTISSLAENRKTLRLVGSVMGTNDYGLNESG
jgi:hypothetical protein